MPSLLLKKMPEDIKKMLLKKQGEIKNEKGVCQFSLELTIYKLLWEHAGNKK